MNMLRAVLFLPKHLQLPPQELKRVRMLHQVWVALGLTGLAVGVGLLCLLLAATPLPAPPARVLLPAFFRNPLLLLLNLLPPVLLVWLFYLVTGRAWAGFLLGGAPPVALALVNYYKILLRGDPLLAADLPLAAEAGGIVGRYTLELTSPVAISLGCFALGLLFALVLLPRGAPLPGVRLPALVCVLLVGVGAGLGLYPSDRVYAAAQSDAPINPWSEPEIYCAQGMVYSFLRSLPDMFPQPPPGYRPEEAAALLAAYPDTDIPPERRVNLVGIMLEAFCDLTDFPALANDRGVQEIYAPWRALEAQSVSGRLLTNVFAGETLDTEWSFLTGQSAPLPFRVPTDSYVWYLRQQGYATQGSHPGYAWFYNRQNVNEFLGFQDYRFSENHFAPLVDPVTAAWHSDEILMREIVAGLAAETEQGRSVFSFSVSYQNHGPYDETANGPGILSPELPISDAGRNIVDNYLRGLSSTLTALTALRDKLEAMEEPVVLVLFGDHKPWLGNGNSVYLELDVSFDLTERQGFYNYYATPYLIWANSAARRVLDAEFAGPGGDFSPCFLLNRVFQLCSWQGPGFMAYADKRFAATPLVHRTGRVLEGQEPAFPSGPALEEALAEFARVQYYRQHDAPRPYGGG